MKDELRKEYIDINNINENMYTYMDMDRTSSSLTCSLNIYTIKPDLHVIN